jgi:TonB-linked SusC/RagA family outer membrane protein
MHKTLSESRKLRPLIISGFLFMLLCCGPLWALADDPNLDQDVVVTGKITSTEDNGPVPGVNVILKGTTQGTVSDADGKYSINVPSAESVLVFSAIGFATQEVTVGARANIDIVLTLDVQTLSEVIVVGYGTQEKRDVTAAISSVNGEALQKIANPNALEGMKGQIAGVDVLQSSGRPGANPSITVRGRRSINASNDPLFVIDGVPVMSGTSTGTDSELAGRSPSLPGGTAQTSGTNPLNDFNPADIASVEVLKDAAATAIYGSRGANGVVLITTKRGKQGKTTVSYSGYYGVTQPFSTFPMMNGQQFADMKREAFRAGPLGAGRAAWDGTIPPDASIFTDELKQVQNNQSTDWQKLIFKNGSQVNHQVSVNGGSEKTQFNLSIGYFKQDGTIPGMDFEKMTARINIDHQISKRFKVGMSNQLTHSIQNNGSDAVMSEAVNQTPLGLPYDSQGAIIFTPIGDAIRSNPLSELVDGKKLDQETINRLFSSAYLEVGIIDGLKYKLLLGTDLRYSDRGLFSGRFTNSQKNGDPAATYQNQSNQGYTLENLVTYNKKFGGDHDFGATFLQSIQGNNYTNHYTSVTGLPYESQKWYNLNSAATISSVRSRFESWSLASFMGRINYTFKGKYMFQATLRADGSSRLAPGHKWTTFPGLSAGWRIKDEAFMSNVEVFSDLKLRASYGVVGNTSIDPYKTQGVLTKSVYSWDEANAAGFALDQISNPNLGWEKSATLDIGLDFGLFNGRLSGTFDVYQTNTTDLLLRRNIPASTGYSSVLANIGATRTTGVELTLSSNIISTPGGFKWDADFNIAHYKEEIVDLAQRDANGNKTDDTGNAWFIGEPIRVFYDYKKIGIWQKTETGDATKQMAAFPGEIKLQDTNKDGVITPADRMVLGNDIPSAYGGLNNRLSYKGFDFSFFFYYRLGYMLDSRFSADQATMQGRYNNLAVDYWTIDNPTNSYPRPNRVQEFPQYNSTLRYQDGGFVKLRTVTLGYSLPSSFLSRYGISSFRVYVSGQNLYAWSNYTLFDPEAAPPSSPGGAQIGAGNIPSNKIFLGGINLTF